MVQIIYPLITAVVLLIVLLYLHYRLVRKPLQTLRTALENSDAVTLQTIAVKKSDVASLARITLQSLEQKELELHYTEKQYRLLFENTLDAVLYTNTSGKITRCNQQAVAVFKATDEKSLLERDITTLFSKNGGSIIKKYFTTLPQEVTSGNFESTLVDTGGTTFSGSIRYTIDTTMPHPEVQFCISDISELKQAVSGKMHLEKHFRHLLKMEAVGQLANGIAHEYNNIFGAVSGYADLLKHHYLDDARLQRYSCMIHSGVKRASLLTNRILSYAHIKKTVREDFDTYKDLSAITELLVNTLPETIKVNVSTIGTHGSIHGDPEQFKTAVMNIALTAAGAMPSGGTLSITAAPFIADNQTARDFPAAVKGLHYISISFTDTGNGMDETTLAHLFEPFHEKSIESNDYGLGMATVYGTIMSHEGFLDVYSSPESGSTITLYFPRISDLEPVVIDPPLSDGTTAILVADDERCLQETLGDMLNLLGYHVTMCSDGTQALATYTAHPDAYALVMLDMNMPGISGLDCLKKMKEIRSDLRALIVTGYYLDEQNQQILDEGICGLILKPFIIEELDLAIKRALT